MAINPSPAAPDLQSRLRDVQVDLRDDLEVSRHVFRGEPCYVVHDPISFQSHRFCHADYRILVSLSPDRSLGSIFESLVASGVLAQEREAEFYEFILLLHRTGFLNLPISDGRLLYRRHKANQALGRKRFWLSFVYLDIPVWNPNAFLDRTIRYCRFLFTWPAFFVWLGLMLVAAYTGCVRHRELSEPLTSLLAAQNLLIMWFTLSGLKLIHELGHAYACKNYSLHVPTLGVYLVAGVPCAYVDASASWSLASSRQRIVICLGGMYFESVVAAISMCVWAVTSPGLLNAIAYNTIFLAGVATVVFNINPLMKYDGYFILGDLVQIPNLGQRAREHVEELAKRFILGLPGDPRPATRAEKAIFLTYGLAAPVYRTCVLVAITAVLASRFYTVGLILGSLYLCYVVLSRLRDMAKYLWQSPETAPIRGRAIAVGIFVLILAPALLAMLPIRTSVQLAGMAFAGTETKVRAASPGFVTAVMVQAGQTAGSGECLVNLANDNIADHLAEANARLHAAEVRRDAYRFNQPLKAVEEAARVAAYQLTVQERQRQLDTLTARAEQPGRVCACLQQSDIGRFIPTGGELATIVSGPPEIHLLLDAEELASTRPSIGQTVQCRLLSRPDEVLTAVVARISPAGNRSIALKGLTHLAGGEIAVQPETGEAKQPYFMVTLSLQDHRRPDLPHGMKAVACLPTRYEPIALHLYRRAARFLDTLERS